MDYKKLNDFFVYELLLGKSRVIRFVAVKGQLINKLNEYKKEIRSSNVDEMIEKMRDVENKMVQDLKKELEDYKAVLQFYANYHNWDYDVHSDSKRIIRDDMRQVIQCFKEVGGAKANAVLAKYRIKRAENETK